MDYRHEIKHIIIGKWVLMGLFIVGTCEVFAYILAPFVYHMIYDKRK